jgi:putative transposase
MHTPTFPSHYKHHRFPTETTSHGAWLHFCFYLSYRDIVQLMARCGVTLTHEALRYGCRKFGQSYAQQLRSQHLGPMDRWHLAEVFPTKQGQHQYLWRAMDQDGNVPGMLVPRRRTKTVAKRQLLPSVEHRQPTHQRQRRLQRFKSPGQAQRFLSAYGLISQHFRRQRHLLPTTSYRREMRQRF